MCACVHDICMPLQLLALLEKQIWYLFVTFKLGCLWMVSANFIPPWIKGRITHSRCHSWCEDLVREPWMEKKTLASKNSTVTPSSKCRLEIFNASKTVQSPRSACACSASHLFSVGRLSASKTIESPHSACRAQCAASKLRSSGGLAHCLENRPISEQCTGTVHGASHWVSVLRFKHHTRHHQRGCAFN